MTMCDGRVDVLDSGGGVQNTVTIDTDRHGSLLRVQRATFQSRLFAPRHLCNGVESVIVGYTHSKNVV